MKKPMPFFFMYVKEWLAANYKFFFLSFLIACISLPKFDLAYTSGVDESLPWAFNYIANGRLSISQNLLFPHGRLAFLMYPLPVGNNLIIAYTVTFLCSFFFSFNMFRLSYAKTQGYVAATLLLIFIQCMTDLQFLLIGVTFSHLLLYHVSKKHIHLISAVIICALAFYVKSYCAVMCSVILAAELIYILITTKNIKPLLITVATFASVILTGWYALYKTAQGLLDFMIGQVELSADNSEAVAYYSPHNWYLISLVFAGILFIRVSLKDKVAKHFFMLMIPAGFAAWKHAMSRADGIHMTALLIFIFLLIFCLFMLSQKVTTRMVTAAIISITAFMIIISTEGHWRSREMSIFKPTQWFSLLTNYKASLYEVNFYQDLLTREQQFNDTMSRIIGNQTADVYPWNYSIIASNHLNWQPRPILQSYAAYTSWLDKKDADHFSSAKAPQFLIWELKKAMGIKSMESIDWRYLLNDEPQTMLSLFSHYTLRYKDSNYLLYEKRSTPVTLRSDFITKPVTAIMDTWVNVPPCDTNGVLRVKLSIQKNIKGAVQSFLYKGEGFSIVYQFEDESEQANKIVPKNAKDGVWIYPYIKEPASDTLDQKIKKIKINCTDPRMVNTSYTVQFEQTHFNYTGSSKNFNEDAFQKSKYPAKFKLQN